VTGAAGEALLECRSVGKTYGEGSGAVQALLEVDLRIMAGEHVAVVGPSGSGKSTLLHILGCLDLPSAGSYHFAGEDVSALDDNALSKLRGRSIGFVFQAFHLFPRLSLLDNVALPLVYQGMALSDRRRLAKQALELVRLDHRAHHLPHAISGGEKQRGAIARAIVHRPSLILADEPTGNLDSHVRNEILGHLDALNRELGMTLVIVTHDDTTAARARRSVRLEDGRVVSGAQA
jgi:putative ABC transport system ATP-binding protein